MVVLFGNRRGAGEVNECQANFLGPQLHATHITLQDANMADGHYTELCEGECFVALTHDVLNSKDIMDRVRSPKAGAIVLFAGTTRDNFNNKPVKELQYQSYVVLALRTMLRISQSMQSKHSLTSVAMVHRLGVVPIGEESILISVSSPHRQAAWRAGEEMLEEVKAKVEIWKKEEFEDGGIWRANRDGVIGEKVGDSGDKENFKPETNGNGK